MPLKIPTHARDSVTGPQKEFQDLQYMPDVVSNSHSQCRQDRWPCKVAHLAEDKVCLRGIGLQEGDLLQAF